MIYKKVSAKDRVQDINVNQLKLKANDTLKKEEKKTTNFEPSNDEDIVNKNYLTDKISKIDSHLSYIEKAFNKKILRDNEVAKHLSVLE